MSGQGGQILSFYSYKGGVGRSMAVANVATYHALRGKRVLVIDFDLEAPGLHRYLLSGFSGQLPRTYSPARPQEGTIELFTELKARLKSLFPAEANTSAGAIAEAAFDVVGALLDSGEYLYEVTVTAPEQGPTGNISFMAAGRFDAGYPERVRSFDWRGLHARFPGLFPALVAVLKERFDYIFVDSRTGVTDTAGICTVLLPDKLVVVFTPNEQSLNGAVEVGKQALAARAAATGEPRLKLFPLISRLDDGEEELKRKWVERAKTAFHACFSEAGIEIDLKHYFDFMRVPYRSYFNYGESIALEHQPTSESGSLAQAFGMVAVMLDEADIQGSENFLRTSMRQHWLKKDFTEFVDLVFDVASVNRKEDSLDRLKLLEDFLRGYEAIGLEWNQANVAAAFEHAAEQFKRIELLDKAREAYDRALKIAEAIGDEPTVTRLREEISRLSRG